MNKKNVIALIVSASIVALFIALPFKVAAALMVGTILLTALFVVMYCLAAKAEEDLQRIEKENPELGKRIRIQMMEEQLRQTQMLTNI